MQALKVLRRMTYASLCVAIAAACGSSESSSKGGPSSGGTAGSIAGDEGGSFAVGGSAGSAGGGATTEAGAAGAAGESDGSGGTSGSGTAGAPDNGAGGAPDLTTLKVADKLDLLFMIDSSISMGDKQQVLQQAVPLLLRSLITPNCLDGGGNVVGQTDESGVCVSGTPEFAPVTDIHIGIISSSLGAHGGQVCATDALDDDHAHLVAKQRSISSWNDSGFLVWDPSGTKSTPPGETDADTLVADFTDHVAAVGTEGCGYEASLEAVFRFLSQPDPPETVVQDSGVTVQQGIDSELLAERAAFLRADSAVAIVLISDENDCSIVDSGQGWLVGYQSNGGTPFRMPRATSACAVDPNSPCCRSCATSESSPPNGCVSLAADVECAKGTSLSAAEDSLNLRCYDQKRRFGFDLLYPISRYLEGLQSPLVRDRNGNLQENALFRAPTGQSPRDASLVFMLGIVGVPWQDVSREQDFDGSDLEYLAPSELASEGRWDVMLGNPSSNVLPTDPLMRESVADRTGTHPLLDVAVAPSSSTDPTENPINGHEQIISAADDLQYACIFPLPSSRTCTDLDDDCDCRPSDVSHNRPLCQPPAGGAATNVQYFAKAYPGLRELSVLKGLGNQGLVASICPKTLGGDTSDPVYGYNPAMRALIRQLKNGLTK